MNTLMILIALPLIASPGIYVVGHRRARLSQWAALLVMVAEWIAFLLVSGSDATRWDGLSALLTGLVLTLGTLVVVFSGPDVASEAHQDKYFAMLIALIGSMIVFNLWVWFECMTITSFLLVAFHRNQDDALEATLKYLVQSAVGSALVLFGVALVLFQIGSLDFTAIRGAATASPLLLAAGALFFIGFGVKAALVPMHTWLPDAHSVAPSGISAMLSGVVIEVGLIALIRVLTVLGGVSLSWGPLLMGVGALNMLVGNLFALRQTTVKRLLAYSSLSQVGYILVGLGIGFYSGQPDGIQGGLFHLFNHGLMKGLAFLAVGALLYCVARRDHQPLRIADLSGAARHFPITALALSVALLGLAGLPPLAGFASKWQIFAAGFKTNNGWIDALVVFAALNSVLSLAYYLPLVNALYRRQESPAMQHAIAIPLTMRVPLVALGFAVLVIGVWPSLLTGIAQAASIVGR